ncbi:MAG: pyridoxamine kinase [Defluviitaleaceae bacterium]|nr:pyridoxamine kinase [Defluviitaleaceae bacterium]
MKTFKKAAAIHDISCFGRCSLTVALPILSAAGVNCSVVPTAVLSTHTGGFDGFTYRDLTEDILPIAKHWQSLGLEFDALYSGFLGSTEQVEILEVFIKMFRRPETVVLVDPVMGDNGKLYKTFSQNFPGEMAKLCRMADLITPNMTEAALLINESYREGPYTREYIESTIKKLASLGGESRQIVLTGVYFSEKELGAAAYDGTVVRYAMAERVPQQYPGTGDVFASALLAALMNGADLSNGTESAVKFAADCIKLTFEAGTDPRFGVNFEAILAKKMSNMIQYGV